MARVSSNKLICWGVTGAIMASIGIVLIPVTDVVILKVLEQEGIIVPSALAYPLWEEVPIPIYFQFWFWNLTNPEEYLQGGPARLVELGPYTYREYRPKVNITHYDNRTASYLNMKSFVFDLEMSVGPESDTFTAINGPVFTIAHWLKNAPDLVQKAWKLIHELSKADVIIELSVDGFVWGYPDKYLELAQRILGEEVVPFTNFGILLGYNNSDDGVWSVYTGEDDLMMLNQMDMWNREKLLPWWTTDYANALNGTDGTIMHPFVDKDEEVYVYSTYVCRSGLLVFKGYREFRGIWLYYFSAPEYLYANASIYPTNIDFCTPDQTTCPPTGLINVSECYFQAPIYLSSPHFLFGDDRLFDDVIGMTPDFNVHGVEAEIEPLSGVTFRGNLRAQVNFKVGPYDFIPQAEHIRDMYLPLIWLNESATLPVEYTDLYHNYVQIPQYVVLTVIVLLVSVGGGIVVGLINFLIWRAWRARKDRLMDEESKHLSSTKNTDEVESKDYGSVVNKVV
eukprot:XP_011671740.1 PREDICTED: lysosome membrane protein 2 isoform X2 [Strongylocentrotus purpuratus]